MQETLTRKALNRALLARQMLLARARVPALDAIEHLVGLQAQQARPPFIGLWSRVDCFQREELLGLVRSREVVRATLMRCTLHLMSARDYASQRAPLQPALTGAMRSVLRERTGGFDLDALLVEAQRVLQERPCTFTDVRAACLRLVPGGDERAMGYSVRTHLPLVIVPDDTPWGYRADGSFTLAESWLGRPLETDSRPHALVLRYLAAFGPAAAADVQAWSGLPRLAPVLEELRPGLRTFRDERKRELFDLPDAPRPPEETPAPARFVADFDNLILSHADRTRVITDEQRRVIITKNALVLPTFLVDGFVAGTWRTSRARKTVTLTVSPFAPLPGAAKEQLAEEGDRLVRFIEPGAEQFAVEFAA